MSRSGPQGHSGLLSDLPLPVGYLELNIIRRYIFLARFPIMDVIV